MTQLVFTALEGALSNIEKYRLDAQLLGMKSYILLTDLKSSRLEKAYLSSLFVLGCPIDHNASLDMSYSSSPLYCGVEEGDRVKIEGILSTSTITRIREQLQWIIIQPVDDMDNDDSIDRLPKSLILHRRYQHLSQLLLCHGRVPQS